MDEPSASTCLLSGFQRPETLPPPPSLVERLLDEERIPMTTAEQAKIVEEVLDEVLGLGPLEPLLKEPSISDILVNRFNKIYIERNGKLAETAVRFKDDTHLQIGRASCRERVCQYV